MQTNSNANTEYYDKMSSTYDEKHQIDMKDFSLFKRQLRKLMPKNYEWDKKKVLDCGCGTGRGALKFARMGCDVTAVDISSEIAKKCHENGKKYGYDIKTGAEDCRKLSFGDEAFDVVSTSAALHHMEDLEKCLSEFKRVTKKGGHLVLIGEPKQSSCRSEKRRLKKEELSAAYDLKVAGVKSTEINPDVYIFDIDELKKTLTGLGYKNITVEYFFFVSSWYRDTLYFRIYNQKIRKFLLNFARILDTYVFFWLPAKCYSLFNLQAEK